MAVLQLISSGNLRLDRFWQCLRGDWPVPSSAEPLAENARRTSRGCPLRSTQTPGSSLRNTTLDIVSFNSNGAFGNFTASCMKVTPTLPDGAAVNLVIHWPNGMYRRSRPTLSIILAARLLNRDYHQQASPSPHLAVCT